VGPRFGVAEGVPAYNETISDRGGIRGREGGDSEVGVHEIRRRMWIRKGSSPDRFFCAV